MTYLTHSLSMRLFLIFGLVALCFHTANAHTYLSSVILNGAELAEGDCVRSHPLTAYDSPISFVNSTNMTCGFLPQSAQGANRKCPITAGSSIGVQWHHQSTAAIDDIIDATHVGPILFYLAKSDTGAGNVWFKIYEDGYTPSDGQWAVNRLINNGGKVSFTIPADISPGNYLLRGELIALHNGYALDGAQPYVGCVELTISGSGSANPAGVAFPGFYKDTDPGMLFNIYSPFTSYPIPGPAVYTAGSSSGSGSSSSGSTTPTTAPTSAPPSNPTTAPTRPTAPPTYPTYAPTSAPPSNPTTAPPSNPTTAPTGNIHVGLHSGTSSWWVGVVVSGGGETTVKVELSDSGSVTAWTALVDNSYAFVFSESVQVTLPISIRLTSSTGKVVTLTNVFTSLDVSSSLVDTGKTYSTTTAPTTAPSRPTTAPTTAPSRPTTAPPTAPTTKPTTAPTTKPTTAPTATPTSGSSSGSNAKVTIYGGSSVWWFAVTISGTTSTISKVELKDSGALTDFTAMTNSQWAYTFATQGTALVTPLTIRVTSSSGQVVTTTVTSITVGSVLETSGTL